MPVPTLISELDVIAANNSPPGTESAKGNIDNYLRAAFAFIKQNNIAMGNYKTATQFSAGAVSTLTAAQAGSYFQLQGGVTTLPSVAGLTPGATFTFSASANSTIQPGTAGDKIYIGGSSYTSVTLGNGECTTITYLANAPGLAVWEVSGGNAFLANSVNFAASLTNSGWRKLPSGDIEQWGQGITNVSGGIALAYPIAFPNAVFHVVAMCQTATPGGAVAMGWQIEQSNPKAVANFYAGFAGAVAFSYRAIGN